MEPISFFVSHRSFDEDPKLKASYSALTNAINGVNDRFSQYGGPQFILREYQLETKGNQTPSSLEEEALDAPCIVFLIGDEMSYRLSQRYKDYFDLNQRLTPNKKVELLVYWRQSSRGKKAKEQFLKSFTDATYIQDYKNDSELEQKAKADFIRIAQSFDVLLKKGQELPRFKVPEDFNWREVNPPDSNPPGNKKKKWWLWALLALAVIAIILSYYNKFSTKGPDLGDENSVTPTVVVDSVLTPGPEIDPELDMTRSKHGHAGTNGANKVKREKDGSSQEMPAVVFEKDAYTIISENNDTNIVFEIERQLDEAQLGLSFSDGGIPQWRIEIRESITDTMRIEYAGNAYYDPMVKLYATIYNSNAKEKLLQADDHARVYDDKEKAINAARDKAKEKLIAKIIDYFKNKLR